MAKIYLKPDSPEGTITSDQSGDAMTLHYNVEDTDPDIVIGFAEMQALVAITAPATFGTLYFQSYRFSCISTTKWSVDVSYGVKQPLEVGEEEWQFDTTGATTKVTHSHASTYYSTGTEIDFQNAINVGKDNQIEGVEITIPKFTFSFKKIVATPMSGTYVDALFQLTGKVNSDVIVATLGGTPFTFEAGELLFKGAQGAQRGVSDAEINLHFEAEPNVTDLAFGDIGGVEKNGFDYLWLKYGEAEDTNTNTLVPEILQVCVEQVLERDNLAILFA